MANDCTILDLSVKSVKEEEMQKENNDEYLLKNVSNTINATTTDSTNTTTNNSPLYACNVDMSTHMNTPPYESDSPKSYDFPYNNYSPILGTRFGPSVYSMQSQASNLFNIETESVQSSQNEISSQNKTTINQMPIPPLPSVTNEGLAIAAAVSPVAAAKKPTRPFKIYPNVPIFFGNVTPEMLFDKNSNEAYETFRLRMLESVKRTNKGTNIKMRRETKGCSPTSTMDDKDEAYREKRKKNNEAAKRSRDARKQKEDEIAIRAAYLEGENTWLKEALRLLKTENEQLRKCLPYFSR